MENTRICQSCGMPIPTDDLLGNNKDGSKNQDYCKYCYKDGEFTENVTLDEYIEKMCSMFAQQAGMTNEEMKECCQKILPTLKRWKG